MSVPTRNAQDKCIRPSVLCTLRTLIGGKTILLCSVEDVSGDYEQGKHVENLP